MDAITRVYTASSARLEAEATQRQRRTHEFSTDVARKLEAARVAAGTLRDRVAELDSTRRELADAIQNPTHVAAELVALRKRVQTRADRTQERLEAARAEVTRLNTEVRGLRDARAKRSHRMSSLNRERNVRLLQFEACLGLRLHRIADESPTGELLGNYVRAEFRFKSPLNSQQEIREAYMRMESGRLQLLAPEIEADQLTGAATDFDESQNLARLLVRLRTLLKATL